MKERIVFLDWLRIVACFMVLFTHSIEPYYLDAEGTAIASAGDAMWVAFLDPLVRVCVPLFVLTSSYLLFPMQGSTTRFLVRRFTRVGIPLVLWGAVYGIWYGGLETLPFNFVPAAGHMWFAYMILGVYFLIPMLSPWVERLSARQERLWIFIWLFTTTIPFLRQLAMACCGSHELLGEANWNEFGTLYYISGFFGYLLLGHYARVHLPQLSWRKTLTAALPLWVAGMAIMCGWFRWRMGSDFPVKAPIDMAVDMEQSIRFCSTGVAMATIAWFLVFRKIKAQGWLYQHVVLPMSQASYGTYLIHMLLLNPIHAWLRPMVDCTPLCILLTAVLTYIGANIISVIVIRIPRVGHWIMG